VGVDDGRELDGPVLDGLLQDRGDSGKSWMSSCLGDSKMLYSLGRMCRVNNNGILGLVIDDEVGVVVALPRPCTQCQFWFVLPDRSWEHTHRNRLDMHCAGGDGLRFAVSIGGSS
jgi:hypothetical protein